MTFALYYTIPCLLIAMKLCKEAESNLTLVGAVAFLMSFACTGYGFYKRFSDKQLDQVSDFMNQYIKHIDQSIEESEIDGESKQ